MGGNRCLYNTKPQILGLAYKTGTSGHPTDLEDAPLTRPRGWSTKQAAGSAGAPAAGKEQHVAGRVCVGGKGRAQPEALMQPHFLHCTDTQPGGAAASHCWVSL